MPPQELIQFDNCRLLRNHALVNEDLWIRDGKIINPDNLSQEDKAGTHRKIDCKGAIIAPGYIDLQINGGYGVDFSNNIHTVEEGIRKVAVQLIRHGTTAFCPTLVTSPTEVYHLVLPLIPKTTSGAQVLGVHLEGPFISPAKKGAHPESFIKIFNDGITTVLKTYGCLDCVKIMTLAPELDPSGEVIKALTKMGITVSMGHSAATLDQAEHGIKNGARMVTHVFNAMNPFNHRDPGLIGALALDIPRGQSLYFGLIADGVHVHPIGVRFAHRLHPAGLVLVTDAISALGLEGGVHNLGQVRMEVRQGKAVIAGTETLCGSIVHLDECVRNLRKITGCSIPYALECATLHPASCIKIEKRKGTLNFGADADFNLLDDDLNVRSTWIDGRCVFNCKPSDLPVLDKCKCST